jgi:hypothetical protein
VVGEEDEAVRTGLLLAFFSSLIIDHGSHPGSGFHSVSSSSSFKILLRVWTFALFCAHSNLPDCTIVYCNFWFTYLLPDCEHLNNHRFPLASFTSLILALGSVLWTSVGFLDPWEEIITHNHMCLRDVC